MRLDPATIKHEIDNLLALYPELAEDEVLRANMVEAETLAFDFLSVIVRKIGDSTLLNVGIASYMDELHTRRDRISRRIEALRAFAEKIMNAADLKRAELPEATLTIANGAPHVVITDETQLPLACIRIKREPNKSVIKDMLTRGDDVSGAVLSNAPPSLRIRVK